MCQHQQDAGGIHHVSHKPSDSFPWQLGAYDAHCHPTDTMASIDALSNMRTSVLTIMATRSQDQDLVAEVAASHGLDSEARHLPNAAGVCKVVPAFGWHPWFSHQLYDDSAPEPTYSMSNAKSAAEAKQAHYRAVLQPCPEDDAFIDALPDPTPLSSLTAATRKRLEAHPLALVGEIGLDRAFRLPQPWAAADDGAEHPSSRSTARDGTTLTPGGREGRRLSPHRVRMPHQQAVLAAGLALAGEMGRAVSVHGVQAHGVLYDTLSRCWAGHELHVPSRREQKMVAPGAEDFSSSSSSDEGEGEGDAVVGGLKDDKGLLEKKTRAPPPGRKTSKNNNPTTGGKPFPPRICLHSFSGSTSTLEQWMRRNVPAKVYVSFSAAVNLSTEAGRARIGDVIRAVPDDAILVESDLHTAGQDMDGMLEDMYRVVCEAKGWELEDGVARIRQNYEAFIFS